MKNFYLMRHGETLFNVQKRTQGWSDSPLTAKGIADAKKAQKFMEKFPVAFDHYYSSTSERACDTLEIVFPEVDYKRSKGLKEMNFGAFEGHPAELEVWDKSVFYKQFAGESREELVTRFQKTLVGFAALPQSKNIFCVTHGAACWFFLEDVVKPTEMPKSGFQNLDLMHLKFDEVRQKFEFVEIIKVF